ncbi:uncharacterized protein METZ01_LOCUS507465, partial [marine metagenome]
ILSDIVTAYVVRAHLGSDYFKDFFYARHSLDNFEDQIHAMGGAEGILKQQEIEGVLALSKQPEIDPAGSFLGRASGHWRPYLVEENLRFSPSLEQELQPLIDHGWKKHSVPPWYTLYARPQEIE